MNIIRTDKFINITSEDGMWLFNGETFSDSVFTPLDADVSIWREVTDEFKREWEKEHSIE